MKSSTILGTFLAMVAVLSVSWLGPVATKAAQVVPRYAKFETSFQLPDTSGNPFDPADNDVQAIFTGPDGRDVPVPAFWDGIWKVRYAPTAIGSYHFRITRNGVAESPAEIGDATIDCQASADPGFVRIDSGSAQAFAFDNGSPYYPIGCDEAWSPETDRTYATAFGHMRDSGMNWARLWMTAWDKKNLEWGPVPDQSPPLGQYLLDVARQWDTILDNATADGVYVQITLQHHGEVTRVVNSEWNQNPYNVANGGFLNNPEDYFTNDRAIALTKAKYRYIVARWGYSDHILSWELFNEIQNDPESNAHFDTVIAWHRTMAAYLRSLDPNRHLVTSSNTEPGNDLEAGVDFDYDQKHIYPADIIGLFGTVEPAAGERPWFHGEWGPLSGNWDDQPASAAFLHDGLWSGLMAPTAGAQQYWHWEYVDANNWWPIFRSVTDYLRASALPYARGTKRLTPAVTCDAKTDLVITLPDGWQATTTYDVTLAGDGTPPNLSGVSEFIQGLFHRDMTQRPVTFHVQCTEPSQFTLRIADIAAGGAHPQLLLDGQPKTDQDFPATGSDQHAVGATLTIDVPAGDHAIGVYNIDHDWYTVESLTLAHYVPAPKTDLVIAMPDGWQATTTYDVTLAGDGTLPNLSGVSEFIQGLFHRDMTQRPVTFHVQCTEPSQFTLRIADIAAGGAHPQLLLDGQPKTDQDFPATGSDQHAVGATLTIDVPAGDHAIGVYNIDHDWYTVDSLTLTHYVPALAVAAKGNSSQVFFWAYNRARPYRQSTPAASVSGTATFTGLNDGTYSVSFWNTSEDRAEGTPLTVTASNGSATVPIQLTGLDIAGYLSPQTSAAQATRKRAPTSPIKGTKHGEKKTRH